MSNTLYIVAARRNMHLAAAGLGGDMSGLWANVGQTSNERSAHERIRDADYSRKNAGGGWVVLYTKDIGYLTDRDIHIALKEHPRVKWENSSNTEEFCFLDDKGDGEEAKRIVNQILLDVGCNSVLTDEYNRLQKEYNRLQEETTALYDLFGPHGVDAEKLAYLRDQKNRADQLQTTLNQTIKDLKIVRATSSAKIGDLTSALNQTIKDYEEDLKIVRRSTRAKIGDLTSALDQSKSRVCNLRDDVDNMKACIRRRNVAVWVFAALVIITGYYWNNNRLIILDLKNEIAEYQVRAQELTSELNNANQNIATLTSELNNANLKITNLSTSKRAVVKTHNTSTPAQSTPAQTLNQFEECIYNKTNTTHLKIDKIMQCNVGGDTLAMKKCLLARESATYADHRHLVDAGRCWQESHLAIFDSRPK